MHDIGCSGSTIPLATSSSTSGEFTLFFVCLNIMIDKKKESL